MTALHDWLASPEVDEFLRARDGVWVRLVNLSTGTGYTAGAPTDDEGAWTIDPRPPAGDYSVQVAPSSSGPYTDTGYTYEVPFLQADVEAAITAKAEDDEVVHNTGDEEIAGIKMFLSRPGLPVDYVDISNDQAVGGLKTHSRPVKVVTTGAAAGGSFGGATAAGPPTGGTWQAGAIVTDLVGGAWICTASGTPGTWVPVGGGGLTKLADVTLGSAQATVPVPSAGVFPQTFRTLLIEANVRSDAVATGTDLWAKCGSGNPSVIDSGARYDYTNMQVLGNGAPSGTSAPGVSTGLRLGFIEAASCPANVFSAVEAKILGYSSTTWEKRSISHWGDLFAYAVNSLYTGTIRSHWRSTAAITSLLFAANAGNLVAGSRIVVYGLQ